jgi:hypothetical protein
MTDRSLPGVLLLALTASSVAFLALKSPTHPKLSILEISVPETMFYSETEYYFAASVVARTGLAEIALKLHWLRSIGADELSEAKAQFGVKDYSADADDILVSIPAWRDILALSAGLGVVCEPQDLELVIEGQPHRLILCSIGPAQETFLPQRIGAGEGERPLVVGDFAVLMNRSGHLVGLYEGYPAFFYDVERTLKSLEVDVNQGKSVYRDRESVSSLPRLRDIPPLGVLRLRYEVREGDQIGLLISIDGRGLRFWKPQICAVEVLADGEPTDRRAFLIR